MTLRTRALQARTRSSTARYVFPLDRWQAEQSNDFDGLLVTLATAGGFQVTFGIPAEARKGLGLTIAQSCGRPPDSEGVGDETEPAAAPVLN